MDGLFGLNIRFASLTVFIFSSVRLPGPDSCLFPTRLRLGGDDIEDSKGAEDSKGSGDLKGSGAILSQF